MRFFNTLTRKVEEFVPQRPGEVTLYTCGPTVYNYAHIGNLRAYLWEDVLKRALRHRGYRVIHVMNITDVDDKTIRDSTREGVSLREYTDRYTRAFFEDLATLRVEPADVYPRATDHVPEMIALIEKLVARGHTYESQGSIYFRISSFRGYGRLSGADLSAMRDGARIDSDEYEKDDVKDFVLWKSKKAGEPSWETPLGEGRPGWHIECSAMSMKYLGETFDIHTGGVDNIFPHHENEIAQSESATGKPFVRLWMHCAHLQVDSEKMAKSKGNFFTLRDLTAQGYDPRAIRYLLGSTHYRKPLNFTLEAVQGSRAAIERLDSFVLRMRTEAFPPGSRPEFREALAKYRQVFDSALDDDLNVAEALASVFDFLREANGRIDAGGCGEEDRRAALDWLRQVDAVFGVMAVAEPAGTDLTFENSAGKKRRIVADFPLDGGVLDRVRDREEARALRDFAAADRVRAELKDQGYALEDTPDGIRVRRG